MNVAAVTLSLSLVLASGHCAVHAQEAPHGGHDSQATRGVAGVWALTMLSHQIGLELAQEDTAVTGTLQVMGRMVEVRGTYVDGRLELDGDGKIGDGRGGEPVPIKLSGRLKDDGTLEGTVKTAHGLEEWTGERLGRQ